MELQVMMEATTETLNATLWPGHSPSPPYQRLSPPVRHEERDIITAQHVSMGYHVADSGLLQWHEKRESPKNSPDTNDQLRSNGGSRGNSSTSEQSSYNQSTNGTKRRSAEANQTIVEPDRKHTRRDGSIGSNGSAQWSSRQVEELAEHLVADFSSPMCALGSHDISNVVGPYHISEALLALPSLTVFKQEAPSPENQADNPNLNHLNQRNLNGPHQNTGNMGLPIEPDSNNNNNNNNNNASATITTNGSTTKANTNHNSANNTGNVVRKTANGERCQSTTASLHQLLYLGNEEHPSTSSSGNHVSSTQGNESTDHNRFQYVLAAATSTATKINEETLTYLNQGQSYEIKLKKLGDLSPYRIQKLKLKSNIRLTFHDRRLQYTEMKQILDWQCERPGVRLLEVDLPLSYGMELTENSTSMNSVEFTWDPTKEVGVHIKVNCISTEFTQKRHGGESGVPFRIQVETGLPNGPRLHAASCQIKVFKLKGADRKHKQDRDRIRRKDPPEQSNYQPSYECTVLVDIPLESLTPPCSRSQNGGSPYTPADAISPRSLDNVGAASPVALPVVPSGTVLALEQSVQENINGTSMSVTGLTTPAAILPNQSPGSDSNTSTESLTLAADANKVQTSAWLCANGFQAFTTTFLNFSAADILRLSRRDLIEICGLADGIRLFNALPKPTKLKLYFAIEGTSRWRCIQIHNLTIGELVSKLLAEFNLPVDRLHTIQLQGPRKIYVDLTTALVADMEDDSTYFIETIREPSSERYKLLLKPFLR